MKMTTALKSWKIALPAALLCMTLSAYCAEPNAPAGGEEGHLFHGQEDRQTLTDGFFGAGKTLEQAGVSTFLSLTQVYQMNLRGGQAVHRRAGRYTGSYDLELTFDLEKIARIKDAQFYLHAEGGWSNGLDNSSIASLFGVNADAMGDEPMILSEAWYEQSWLDRKVTIRAGK